MSDDTIPARPLTSARAAELVAERSVADRVVIVTGAASGMGRATAELFGALGAKVAAADVSTAQLDAVVAGIVEAGGEASAHRLDVTDNDAITTFVDVARAAHGPIDILINNAGIAHGGPIDGEEFADAWYAVFAVNLHAHMHLIRACLPDLARNGDGRIINISSTEGLGGTANNSAYGAAKHGVIGLTKSLAVELGPKGITVNAICPGPVHTGMTELIPDEAKATFARRRTALRRYGQPHEVAHMTVSLAMPAASFVTGVALPVDGGMIARNQ
ncbi:MAG: SDR family oxidoreductase [Acidimicrobiales bacterium]|nr:SDR family oxidoreductase [Acidimicrobiales bacterium]